MFKTYRRPIFLVIEGHMIKQVCMDEVLRSVVLPFCATTNDGTRPRMTIPEHTSLESAKTMLCALTGRFATILTCL